MKLDILKRLQGYNTPDRTLDDQREIAVDIQDAAEEIERLRSALQLIRDGMPGPRLFATDVLLQQPEQ